MEDSEEQKVLGYTKCSRISNLSTPFTGTHTKAVINVKENTLRSEEHSGKYQTAPECRLRN